MVKEKEKKVLGELKLRIQKYQFDYSFEYYNVYEP